MPFDREESRIMSLLTFLRGDRSTRPLAPEPEIVEDTFKSALVTEPPNDNIVLLGGGQNLVFFDEHRWSIRGTAALRALLMPLPGDSTVITCVTMRAADLLSLANENAWSSTHADPETVTKEKGHALTSLFIGNLLIVESHERQHPIKINGGGSCNVVILTTDYLDDICHRYDCHAMKNPHENCTWLAYKEVLSSIFQTRKNFGHFVPSDQQVDDILDVDSPDGTLTIKPLSEMHINAVKAKLSLNAH
jgi:hypothetical protein